MVLKRLIFSSFIDYEVKYGLDSFGEIVFLINNNSTLRHGA